MTPDVYSGLTELDERTHAALLDMAGSRGSVSTTYRGLSDAAGCARSTIHTCLRRLSEAGLIEVELPAAGGIRITVLRGSS